MKFSVYIELEHVSGPEKDQETMIDAFCGQIGQQNGAGAKALKVKAGYEDDDAGGEAVYIVKLADDRP